MKINPLTTTPSDLILHIHGKDFIHYFYTGFWFLPKKELFCGCFSTMKNDARFKYKVVNRKKKTINFYNDRNLAFEEFLNVENK